MGRQPSSAETAAVGQSMGSAVRGDAGWSVPGKEGGMLLGWSLRGGMEKGDSGERREPPTTTAALQGHAAAEPEPLCSAKRFRRCCGKEIAAPATARGQSHRGDVFGAWPGGCRWLGTSRSPGASPEVRRSTYTCLREHNEAKLRPSTLSPCSESLRGHPAALTSYSTSRR